MSYASLETVKPVSFGLADLSGQAVDADAIPAHRVMKNGVDDTINWPSAAIANFGTGDYRFTPGNVPISYISGDEVQLQYQAIIDVVTGKWTTISSFRVRKSNIDDLAGIGFNTVDHSLVAIKEAVLAGQPDITVADGQIITVGSVDSGSFTDTAIEDDNYLIVTPDVGGNLDVRLTYQLQADRVPSSFNFDGRLESGINREVEIQVYNEDLLDFRELTNPDSRLQHSVSDSPLLSNLDKNDKSDTRLVTIRYWSDSLLAPDTLYIDLSTVVDVASAASGLTASQIATAVWDKAIAEAALNPDSTGAALIRLTYQGAVWIDTNGPARAAVPGNGGPSTPFNNLADARAIADYFGTRTLGLIGNSQITLDKEYRDFNFLATSTAALINLNNKDVSFTVFNQVALRGEQGDETGGFSLGPINAEKCLLLDLQRVWIKDSFCKLIGPIELRGGDHSIDDARSAISGDIAPPIIFPPGEAATLSMGGYAGGIDITMTESQHTMSIEVIGGNLIINENSTNGSITRRGIQSKEDLSGGAVTVTEVAALDRTVVSNFDANADLVDVGFVAGIPVSGPDDMKADLTTLESRLTGPRATNLDNLDALISSRSVFNPFTDVIENNGLGKMWTAVDVWRLGFAVDGGEWDGGTTTNKTVKVPGGSKVRLIQPTDGDGNSAGLNIIDVTDVV